MPSTPADDKPSPSIATGLLVCIVASATISAVLIAIALYYFVRHRRRLDHPRTPPFRITISNPRPQTPLQPRSAGHTTPSNPHPDPYQPNSPPLPPLPPTLPLVRLSSPFNPSQQLAPNPSQRPAPHNSSATQPPPDPHLRRPPHVHHRDNDPNPMPLDATPREFVNRSFAHALGRREHEPDVPIEHVRKSVIERALLASESSSVSASVVGAADDADGGERWSREGRWDGGRGRGRGMGNWGARRTASDPRIESSAQAEARTRAETSTRTVISPPPERPGTDSAAPPARATRPLDLSRPARATRPLDPSRPRPARQDDVIRALNPGRSHPHPHPRPGASAQRGGEAGKQRGAARDGEGGRF